MSATEVESKTQQKYISYKTVLTTERNEELPMSVSETWVFGLTRSGLDTSREDMRLISSKAMSHHQTEDAKEPDAESHRECEGQGKLMCLRWLKQGPCCELRKRLTSLAGLALPAFRIRSQILFKVRFTSVVCWWLQINTIHTQYGVASPLRCSLATGAKFTPRTQTEAQLLISVPLLAVAVMGLWLLGHP